MQKTKAKGGKWKMLSLASEHKRCWKMSQFNGLPTPLLWQLDRFLLFTFHDSPLGSVSGDGVTLYGLKG